MIRENIGKIEAKINAAAEKSHRGREEISLVAVSKGHAAAAILEAREAGAQIFGESYVQEFLQKHEEISKLATAMPSFHFIGHLQSNKVKYIIDKVELIHSVDRLSLAEEIDRQARKIGKVMEVLVEVNIGNEESKSGISPERAERFLREISGMRGIKVCGFMTIPPNIDNFETNLLYFSKIYQLFIDIGAKNIDNITMRILSMGMSDDFETAIECGSTHIRIGTAIFGERAKKISI